jgi:hypothetical protein
VLKLQIEQEKKIISDDEILQQITAVIDSSSTTELPATTTKISNFESLINTFTTEHLEDSPTWH